MTAETDPLDAGHWQKMTIVRAGREYTGHWGLLLADGGREARLTVVVCFEGARHSARLGGRSPEFAAGLARQLLGELIDGVAATPAGASAGHGKFPLLINNLAK